MLRSLLVILAIVIAGNAVAGWRERRRRLKGAPKHWARGPWGTP